MYSSVSTDFDDYVILISASISFVAFFPPD